jgi:purine-nucleoside/S-methyl-5'-thioadenosine phosphorylase / adenosine deaminase
MAFFEQNGVRYFSFDSFESKSLVHGVFSRHGGVSPKPWSSLNLGGTVGDERGRVMENRRRMFEAVDLPVNSLYDAWQVHGDRVMVIEKPRPLEQNHAKADALITSHGNVTLLMRFADCVPIFLYDQVRRVVGIAHAGWMGTVKKIGLKTVQEMTRVFGCKPGDVMAGIGPSIGPDEYEVGENVIEEVRKSFPDDAENLLLEKQNGSVHLDLWEANRLTLVEAGLGRIEIAGISTAAHTDDWYSHRAENGKTGRMGALIALR